MYTLCLIWLALYLCIYVYMYVMRMHNKKQTKQTLQLYWLWCLRKPSQDLWHKHGQKPAFAWPLTFQWWSGRELKILFFPLSHIRLKFLKWKKKSWLCNEDIFCVTSLFWSVIIRLQVMHLEKKSHVNYKEFIPFSPGDDGWSGNWATVVRRQCKPLRHLVHVLFPFAFLRHFT